jgi:hypothetical protein
MSKIVQVSKLSKSFGDKKAVRGISFDVEEGEIFGILGPNGAGKTTTLEMIEAIQTIDSGTVTLDGINVEKNPRDIRYIIGVQPQSPAFQDKTKLVEKSDGTVARLADAPLIHLHFAINEFEQRGFSTSIEPNQADLVVWLDKHGRVFIKCPSADEVRDIRYRNHALDSIRKKCPKDTIPPVKNRTDGRCHRRTNHYLGRLKHDYEIHRSYCLCCPAYVRLHEFKEIQ